MANITCSSLNRLARKSVRRSIGLLSSQEILEALLDIAQEIKQAHQRGVDLGLSDDELAFYDALETNDSAVSVLGDNTLRLIAQTLVEKVRENVSIDWELREDARARMRVIVKRILKQHGYPPDKAKHATQLVVQQAELLTKQWSVG